MISASTRADAALQQIRPATPLAEPRTRIAATLATLDGRFVTGGLADITVPLTGGAWTATLTHLDRPGIVATLFFSEGTRDVMVRLEDGRRARARMTATSFVVGERICQIAGVEPLT